MIMLNKKIFIVIVIIIDKNSQCIPHPLTHTPTPHAHTEPYTFLLTYFEYLLLCGT